jgi:GDP-D-mannose dehydratase
MKKALITGINGQDGTYQEKINLVLNSINHNN